jgi:hypothetical protein
MRSKGGGYKLEGVTMRTCGASAWCILVQTADVRGNKKEFQGLCSAVQPLARLHHLETRGCGYLARVETHACAARGADINLRAKLFVHSPQCHEMEVREESRRTRAWRCGPSTV